MEETYYRDREYLLKDRTYGSGLFNSPFGGLFSSTNIPPVDKTLGVDTSHWNGFSDYYKMKSRGIQWGVYKASDVGWGSKKPFLDERLEYNHNGMKNAGMLKSGYCWLDPHPYTTPEQQANFYLDEYYFKYEVEIPPVLDFEDRDVISWDNMLWRAQVWLEVVEHRTGKVPILYTSPGYMSAFSRAKTGFLKRYPLWVAHYIQRTYPTIPYPWDNYLIWQYSDRGHYPYYVWNSGTMHGREWGSGSSYLDMNWWNGTYEMILEFCETQEIPDPDPPPPPPSEEVLFKARCTATILNVRRGPSIAHPIVSTIGKDVIREVYEERFGWYRIGKDQWVSGQYMFKVSDTGDVPVLFRAKCVVNVLNKRSGPSTLYAVLGQLKKDEIVNVYEVKNSWFRIEPNAQIWVSGYPTYMRRI